MRLKKKKSLFIKLGILVSAFIGVLCSLVVPTKAAITENASYVSKPYNGYIQYYTSSNEQDLCTYYFVYQGDRYTHAEQTDLGQPLEVYTLSQTEQNLVDTSFVSDYGWFIEDYGQYNGITGFLFEFASTPSWDSDMPWKLVLEYQAPVQFINTPFNCQTDGMLNVYLDQQLITSFNGYTIENFTANRLEYVGQNDFARKPTYISSNSMDTYWVGYYKARNEDNITIRQLEDANRTLQRQLAEMNNNNGTRLIWAIASTPFESFKTIWDVDVMGLNIGGIVLGSMIGLIIVWILKKVF